MTESRRASRPEPAQAGELGKTTFEARVDHPVSIASRLQFSPFVMRFTGKHVYPFLTRVLGDDEVLFLNWAYDEEPPMALPLAASDEPNRYPIQLYHRTAT